MNSLYAGTTEEYLDFLENTWQSFFDMMNSFMWILAIVPVAVVLHGLIYSFQKLKKAREDAARSGMALSFEELGDTAVHTLGYLTAVYLIYGMFAMIFAGAPDIGYGWEHLVHTHWSEFLSSGNTTP